MKIIVEKKEGWFQFLDENHEYLSCRFDPIVDGIWEVAVNDNGLQRGYSIGKIEKAGDETYFFVPNIEIESINER
jgi:hypothetical protein